MMAALGLLCESCGRPSTMFEPVRPHDTSYVAGHWNVDPYLASSVDSFLDAVRSAGLNFGNIDQVSSITCVKYIEDHDGYPTMGLTVYTDNWGVQILVNCSYQKRYTTEILYHEMTHGLYDLDHSNDPTSIHHWLLPDYDEIKDDAVWQQKVSDLMEFIQRGSDE